MKNIFNENPNESLGFFLTRVYALRSKKMDEGVQPLEINYVQYNLLTGLYRLQLEGKSVNQMMLIHFTKLDKSVVSNMLSSMSKEGYVSRVECPDDTRAKIVSQVDKTFWGENPTKPIYNFLNEVVTINS